MSWSPRERMEGCVVETLESNWTCDVLRGPDCLIIRLHVPRDAGDNPHLAQEIWQRMQNHFVYRLVLDLQDVPTLRSQMIGQLLCLREKILDHDGMLRLCGLSDTCRRTLKKTNLDERLAYYSSQADAVMGRGPLPR